MKRMTLFAAIVVAGFLNNMAFGQTNATEEVWKDGFLDKTYSPSLVKVNSAIMALFGFKEHSGGVALGGCVVIAIGEIKEEGAYVTTYAVADKNGKWGGWKGGKSIEGFNAKEGGSRVQVKVAEKKDAVLVGFKVDDGDKALSQALHELLAKKLTEAATNK